ncbi:LysM peptidoglycan-binding domain-containing protein (plasmid) [Acidithiobacillus ferriphilus]|uniref:LysM peptidoglycan-binding domain-containing protein n=1 Tax=Acidithiobacillus TaxID=119977 RepID=UPI0034E4F40E
MLKEASIGVLASVGIIMTGCAQMQPQNSHNDPAAEVKHLMKKQEQLSLATDAISGKLARVQTVISNRLRENKPLIAPVAKDHIIKRISVTMPENDQADSLKETPIGGCIPETIIIKPGDTLSGIAARTNTTIPELKNWNSLPGYNIDSGKTLVVSRCPGT